MIIRDVCTMKSPFLVNDKFPIVSFLHETFYFAAKGLLLVWVLAPAGEARRA